MNDDDAAEQLKGAPFEMVRAAPITWSIGDLPVVSGTVYGHSIPDEVFTLHGTLQTGREIAMIIDGRVNSVEGSKGGKG
jgi:hypothetical protein